jgi:hypothetical protein
VRLQPVVQGERPYIILLVNTVAQIDGNGRVAQGEYCVRFRLGHGDELVLKLWLFEQWGATAVHKLITSQKYGHVYY